METIFLLRILVYEITEDKNCAFYECGGVFSAICIVWYSLPVNIFLEHSWCMCQVYDY